MASTKIKNIKRMHVDLVRELGIEPVAAGASFVVLPGNRVEAAKTLADAREAFTGEWNGSKGNLFGTLRLKLEEDRDVVVTEDAPADAPVAVVIAGAQGVMVGGEEESNVVNGPWEYDAPEGDQAAEEAPVEAAPAEKAPKAAKAKPEPKRAALPEDYTTPVGLAKVINERGLYTGKREDGLLTSQSMYVYIKNNGPQTAHPFPLENIGGRPCMKIEAGVQWWKEHQERVAAKAEAAAARKAEKAEKAAARAAQAASGE